jgi:hypothetical protein
VNCNRHDEGIRNDIGRKVFFKRDFNIGSKKEFVDSARSFVRFVISYKIFDMTFLIRISRNNWVLVAHP